MSTIPSISTTQITKATLLGINKSSEFFDGDIAWKSVSTITVEVIAHNVSNNDGIISEISQLTSLRDGQDWSHIYINGTYHGLGKLIGFSLQDGTLSQLAKCNLTFNVFNEGDDIQSLSGYYEDYKDALSGKPFIDSMSENISLNRGENSISYSKQVNIKFSNSLSLQGSQSGPIQMAQDFAKKIFNKDASLSYSTIPDIDSEDSIRALLVSGFRKIRSESINMITNECSFTETIDAQNVRTNYSHTSTQSISIDNNGIATVTEQGTIRGLEEPILSSANSGYTTEISDAKTRMLGLFNAISECGSLNTDSEGVMFISSSKTVKEESGVIEYSVSADNDPKKSTSSNNVMYERTTTISKSNGYSECVENGTIIGLSKMKYDGSQTSFERYPKYSQAKTYYSTIFAAIKTRIKAELDVPSPEYVSREESHSLFNGQISYSIMFSENPLYSQNSTYKSFQTSSQKTYPSEKFYTFGILNEKTIVQNALNPTPETQGNVSNNVSALLYRKNPSETQLKTAKNDLLTKAKTLFNLSNETESSDYPTSASYDFSYKNDVSISLSASYIMNLMEEAQ